ncbi:phage tail protein [uncultured Prevotella sp.]|uniref:phage tail protein n=1 Tax=uncultured Prevotella sp. TaxID=159272 RepID=UPI0020518524|nr:phage tail protein [uncultured Prevotella sp.]DAQ22285.1 MAG TPA: tail tube protein [Caudoviricetes sp.]
MSDNIVHIDKLKYIRGFHFLVSFSDGINVKNMGWQEVSGFNAELQVEEVSEGGENQFTWRLPKPPRHKNLVLKRALGTKMDDLIKWAKEAIEGFVFKPATVVVQITGDNDEEVLRSWNFVGAYPVKIQTTELSAQKGELVIETLELAYKYFIANDSKN